MGRGRGGAFTAECVPGGGGWRVLVKPEPGWAALVLKFVALPHAWFILRSLRF